MVGAPTKVFLTIFVGVLATVFQMYIKPYLTLTGVYPERVVRGIANDRCEIVRGMEACEKIILHQPTGIVYMTCSFPSKRRLWTPALDRLDPNGYGSDYIASYNPKTKKAIRMKFSGLEPNRFSSHGFDIQQNPSNSSELFFYLIHHRVPDPETISSRLLSLGIRKEPLTKDEKRDWRVLDRLVKDVGAESVVQVFSGTWEQDKKGSSRLTFEREFKDVLIETPNDVLGQPDGKGFWWTNDHGSAVGKLRNYEIPARLARSTIGYCSESAGCKIASSQKLIAANGIAGTGNGSVYVSTISGHVWMFESQKDGSLVGGEKIDVGMPLDNIAIAADGAIYTAGYPKIDAAVKFFDDTSVISPSAALRITKNGGPDQFFGKKYAVDTAFSDLGFKAPPASSVVVDSERKLMFLHGVASPYLVVCKI